MPDFPASSATAPLDTERVLRALNDADVHYILIGGVACVMHGAEQTTYDTDVLPSLDEENLERLLAALESLSAAVLVDPKRMELEDGEAWRRSRCAGGVKVSSTLRRGTSPRRRG